MKILQIIPQFVLPATDGGKIGILNLCKEFAKENELTFIIFSNFTPNESLINEMNKFGKTYFIIKDISNSYKNILISIFKNQPVYLSKFYNRSVLSQVENIINNIEFDVIHADHTSMAQIALYISNKTKKPWGLRLHNLEHIIWSRYSDNLSKFNLKKYISNYQAKLLRKKEFEYIEKSFVNFPITQNDLNIINHNLENSNSILVGAGVDSELNKPINIAKINNSLCIATTYNWIHNVNGLIWFFENVLPLIKIEIPEVKFNLFGKNIPELFNKYIGLGVESIGFVEDLSFHLSQSELYIAPLFVGSGIRIKILEAMAHGLPVIATKVSAEGINIDEKNGLYITDSAIEQSEIIINLLKNKDLLTNKGNLAREYILTHYNWNENATIIKNEYTKLIKSSS